MQLLLLLLMLLLQRVEVRVVVQTVAVQGSKSGRVLRRYNEGVIDGAVVRTHQHQAVGGDRAG